MNKSANTEILQTSRLAVRRVVIAVSMVSLFINVLMLTVPLYMLQLYDRVLTSRSEDTLIYLTIAAVGALAVMAALDMFRARALARVGTWVEQRLGPVALERAVTAVLQSREYGPQALRDITQLRQFIGSPGIASLFDAPWIPVYLFIIYLFHPLLGLVALGGAIVLIVLAVTNELVTREPLEQASGQWASNARKVDATLRNAEVIESMGIMPTIVRRWSSDSRKTMELLERAGDRGSILLAISRFSRLAVQVGMLGIGAYLVVLQDITAGVMIAASIILSRALFPVEQAIGTWKSFVTARAAYSRIKVFMEAVPSRQTDIALPDPAGHLLVENVYFAPPGADKPSLKGVSFELQPGEVLAIIGPSAAGKSTLARLIVGVWQPYAGNVRLDSADVFTWDRVDFGRHVGYLPQDVELFGGTIAENIARMGDVNDHAVVEAAKRAGVHEMILRIPNGYSAEIGEGGLVLSAGQRQRIALARALFEQPRLIVLDEPNANLDEEGESALRQAIVDAKERGSTIIFISHRPSMVTCADKVMFLHDGVVKLVGPREEVLPQVTRAVSVDQGLDRPGTA